MKKFLTALVVVGALALTAAPVSAHPAFRTIWHSASGRLEWYRAPHCDPYEGCGTVEAFCFTNLTNHATPFQCDWYPQPGQPFTWQGQLAPHAHVQMGPNWGNDIPHNAICVLGLVPGA